MPLNGQPDYFYPWLVMQEDREVATCHFLLSVFNIGHEFCVILPLELIYGLAFVRLEQTLAY